jgi:hypothetical protein
MRSASSYRLQETKKYALFTSNDCSKTGHGQHSSKFVICVVLFVIRVVLLLIVMIYVLFMCKCVLPPGVNPFAVDKYINININDRTSMYGCLNRVSERDANTHFYFLPHP